MGDHATGWLGLTFMPSIDGQTIVSIVLGAALTILTFLIGYRRTIGAQDERLRAANAELCSSVIKRVAVEREAMTPRQFSLIRRAKAYKAQVPEQKLIDFQSALSVALLETIDNNFLDSPSKKSIIELLDESYRGSPELGIHVEHNSSKSENIITLSSREKDFDIKVARNNTGIILSLAGLSIVMGVVSSVVYTGIIKDIHMVSYLTNIATALGASMAVSFFVYSVSPGFKKFLDRLSDSKKLGADR